MVDPKKRIREMFLKVSGVQQPEENGDVKKYAARMKQTFPNISDENAEALAKALAERTKR
jgi:hypothetical protein